MMNITSTTPCPSLNMYKTSLALPHRASDSSTRCSSKGSSDSNLDFCLEDQERAVVTIHNTFIHIQVIDEDQPKLDHRAISAPATPANANLSADLLDSDLDDCSDEDEFGLEYQVKFADPKYTVRNTFICDHESDEEQPKLHRHASAPCETQRGFTHLEEAEVPSSGASTSSDHSNASLSDSESDTNTTVIIQNLPVEWKQSVLITYLVQQGFHGRFNFVYMPMNFRTGLNVSYAFVNLQDHSTALDLMQNVQEDAGFGKGFGKGALLKPSGLKVEWSSCQGYDGNIDRFRNSSVMHSVVPPECKPTLYDQLGNVVSFPEPTAPIRKPRIHMSANDHVTAASHNDEIVMAIKSACRSPNGKSNVAVDAADAGRETQSEHPKRKAGRGKRAGKK